MPVISALRRLMQEDCQELKASLCYVARPSLKMPKKMRGNRKSVAH